MSGSYDGNLDRWPVSHLPSDQARLAFAVTPSDTLDLPDPANAAPTPNYAKALYIGVSGDVTVIMAGDKSNAGQGTAVKFTAHPIGYLPGQVRRVLATGTTASSILALMD